MRVPSSLKVILSTWLAALVGMLAGRVLAEATGASHGPQAHAPVVTSVQSR
jgi:hypothetical protein